MGKVDKKLELALEGCADSLREGMLAPPKQQSHLALRGNNQNVE